MGLGGWSGIEPGAAAQQRVPLEEGFRQKFRRERNLAVATASGLHRGLR